MVMLTSRLLFAGAIAVLVFAPRLAADDMTVGDGFLAAIDDGDLAAASGFLNGNADLRAFYPDRGQVRPSFALEYIATIGRYYRIAPISEREARSILPDSEQLENFAALCEGEQHCRSDVRLVVGFTVRDGTIVAARASWLGEVPRPSIVRPQRQ